MPTSPPLVAAQHQASKAQSHRLLAGATARPRASALWGRLSAGLYRASARRHLSNARHQRLLAGATARGGVTILALALGAASVAHAGDWPGFRGPGGRGHWDGPTVLSKSEAVGLTVAWKVPIGSGYSGVAVCGSRVVTLFNAGDDQVAAAFDRDTGRELWRARLEEKFIGNDGAHDGPISTPLVHDGRVFCYTPRGRLVALDAETGKTNWAVDVVKDLGANAPPWGFASSPIAAGGVVAIQLGGDDQAVVGFDPATGQKRWGAGSDGVFWQSPIVAAAGDGPARLLAACGEKIMAIDPTAGKLVWAFPHGGRNAAAATCVPIGPDRLFLHNRDEGSAIYRVSGDGDDFKHEAGWDNRHIRKTYNVPVCHDGRLYGYSVRFLTCLDAGTGEPVWRSRAPGDGFLILVDGHLVIATKRGSVHVARATPAGYEERASVQVFDDVAWDHPAFADDSIFVRSHGELARVDVRPAAAPRIAVDTNPMPDADAGFAAFLSRLDSADDKAKRIDEFLGRQKQFPIIEQDRYVHFIYRGPAEDVAIAGDLWGARQDRPMKRVAGTDLFYYTAELAPDARLCYLFIKDFKEQMPDPRNPRRTPYALVGADMEISMGESTIDMSWFAMPKWRAPAYFDAAAAATVKGRIVTHELDSALLGKKHAIDVYVPAGYEESTARLPVAYVHGGRRARALGGLDAALDGIVGADCAPVIVVFIQHEPGFSPDDKYGEIFATEIVPFIDHTYRTIAEPIGRASIGHGFAGFIALSTTFLHPGVVGKVGCQSPFMFGSMEKGLRPSIPLAKDVPLEVYIEWGAYDYRNPHDNWDLGEAAERFAARLAARGYANAGGEVQDGTDWASWRNRYDKLFATLFPR